MGSRIPKQDSQIGNFIEQELAKISEKREEEEEEEDDQDVALVDEKLKEPFNDPILAKNADSKE